MTHHPQIEEQNSSVRKADESVREEFYREFVITHPGDSGINGSDPQEPICEVQYENPDEIVNWWLSKLHTEREEMVKEFERYVDENVIDEKFNRQWLKLLFKDFLSTLTLHETSDYERDHSHTHCWESKNPPCGLKGRHRCCLCEKPVPNNNAQ